MELLTEKGKERILWIPSKKLEEAAGVRVNLFLGIEQIEKVVVAAAVAAAAAVV